MFESKSQQVEKWYAATLLLLLLELLNWHQVFARDHSWSPIWKFLLSKKSIRLVTLMDFHWEVQKRLFKWTSRFFLVGHKFVLIKHVLRSMPIHLIGSIGLLKGVTNRLKKPFSSFFWNNSDNSNTSSVSWSAICTPTSKEALVYDL